MSAPTNHVYVKHLPVPIRLCALPPLGRGYSATHLITGSYPINLNSPTLILSRAFEHFKLSAYDSKEAKASLSSSRLNFPDFTASMMDFGEAEILALEPLRRDA